MAATAKKAKLEEIHQRQRQVVENLIGTYRGVLQGLVPGGPVEVAEVAAADVSRRRAERHGQDRPGASRADPTPHRQPPRRRRPGAEPRGTRGHHRCRLVDDTSCRVEIATDSLDWATFCIGALDAPVVVHGPPEAIAYMRAWGRRLTAGTQEPP
ncbi:hypothetical protein ACTMTI_48895 [Nonomuraea sp. H19]|uniref:hypothetical protein n=1 Tax=Nonomuraea sp. H19 TaxID=3452206 RepID=UPI003F888071